MLTQLRLSIGRFFERYGLVLHLCALLTVSYLALAWVLRSGGWGESFRLGRTQVHEGGRPVARSLHVPHYGQLDEVNGWQLLATLSDEGGANFAVVSHAGARIFLHQGDMVGSDLTVRSVERGTLTIDAGGRQHTLALVGERPATAPVRGTRIDLSRRAAGELFPQLQWVAVPLGGKFVGMRLRPQGGATAAAFGLRDGDTLESVNGLPVTGDDARERLVERFRTEDALNLGVRREGRLVNVFVALYE